MEDCLSCDGRIMGWCAYCANYPPTEQEEGDEACTPSCTFKEEGARE